MKASLVTFLSLAGSALAAPSASQGREGFQVFGRETIGKNCEKASTDATTKCQTEGLDNCDVVGRVAQLGCRLDNIKVEETSDALHNRCRLDATTSVLASSPNSPTDVYRHCVENGVTASKQAPDSTPATAPEQAQPGQELTEPECEPEPEELAASEA